MEINFFSCHSRKPAERFQSMGRFHGLKDGSDYMEFGFDYFDNPKIGIGYGGYNYDGRYASAAKKMIEHYKLKAGSKVLEVGCAKGFILVEFLSHIIKVRGFEKSAYARAQAHPDVKDFIDIGNIESGLPYKDKEFDLVFAKEVLPHINHENLNFVIKECMRVGKNVFFEIQCGENENELDAMKKWDLTHKISMTSKQWLAVLNECGYKGDYYFKVLMKG